MELNEYQKKEFTIKLKKGKNNHSLFFKNNNFTLSCYLSYLSRQ